VKAAVNRLRITLAATLAVAALTITTASAQNVFVANSGNNTVSEFNSSGTLITSSFASGLSNPEGLAFDSSGNLYVVNSGNNTISEFNSSGTLITGSFASGLSNPEGLAFDSSGNLYVANNNGIWEFGPSGTLIKSPSPIVSGLSATVDLAFDSRGNLYVTMPLLNAVEEYDSRGNLIKASPIGSVNDPSFLAISPEIVPEPSTWALAGMGLATLLALRWRKVVTLH
jgi:DNA-binding beta-propeller fold protein YncE